MGEARIGYRDLSIRLYVAQDRQANVCLHAYSFAGRKNMEHEVRNVRVRNREGAFFPYSLVD